MADMVVTLSGDEAKLFRAQQKIIEQQAKLHANYDKAAAKSNLLTETAKGFATVESAFKVVEFAVDAVNSAMEDQVQLQQKALRIARELAGVQSGSSKNLTGLLPSQKQEAFKAADQVQRDTGFSDQESIVGAIGDAYGILGDVAKATDAARVAAKMSVNNPEDMKEYAVGLADTMKASGKSAEEAMGILLNAQSVFRISSFGDTAKHLSNAMNNSVMTVKGQDRAEASRQTAAAFGALNQNDPGGDKTSTSTIGLTGEMQKFFERLPKTVAEIDDQRVQKTQTIRRSELGMEEASLHLAQSEADLKKYAGIDRATAPAEVQNKIRSVEIAAEKAKDDHQRASEELAQARRELSDLDKKAAALKAAGDSGTVEGRISSLQKDSTLRDVFLERHQFGDTAFKGPIKELLTAGSEMDGVFRGLLGKLQYDPNITQQEFKDASGLTTAQVAATGSARADAMEQEALTKDEKPIIASVQNATTKALELTRGTGSISGAADWTMEKAMGLRFGGASSLKESVEENLAMLTYRAEAIQYRKAAKNARFESTDSEDSALKLIRDAMDNIKRMSAETNDLLRQQNNKVDNQTEVIQSQQTTPNQIRASVQDGRNR